MLSTAEQRLRRLTLQERAQEVVTEATREGTIVSAWRGINVLEEYGDEYRASVLPTSAAQLVHWATWGILIREPTYDTTSIQTLSSGISRWHAQTAEAMESRLVNPVKTVMWREFIKAAGKTHKNPSSAKQPFTAIQFLTIALYGFDLSVVGGLHGRLVLMLLGLGPFRPKLACSFAVDYEVRQCADGTLEVVFGEESEVFLDDEGAIVCTVKRDKNVTKLNQRLAHIPESAMGFEAADMLIEYLLVVRPPKGYLTAAPVNMREKVSALRVLAAGWYREGRFHTGPYTASSKMIQRAYKMAFPGSTDEALYGGGTPRKSLAEFLWAAGFQKRIIRDLGGWAVPKQEAVDMYFRTRPHKRKKILSSLLALLLAAEELECPKSGPITTWEGWGGGQWADMTQLELDSDSEEEAELEAYLDGCGGPPGCEGCSTCGLSDYASSCSGED